VVGATGDIGREISVALAQEGFSLALTRSTGSREKNGYFEFEPLAPVHWFRTDVKDSSSVNNVVMEAQRIFGDAIDLVYCVGALRDTPIALCTDEAWHYVIDVNLTGAFYFIRAVARQMMVKQAGRIILIGSVSGKRGSVGQSGYSAAKAGLEGLCRVAAVELGRYQITVNVVSPGAIESSMMRGVRQGVVDKIMKATPMRRLGTPKNVADVVMFLLSEGGSYVSGQTILVDGGLTIT
jgi:3-oxoacyl-[acyl-carrier protein] reductase